MFKLFKQKNNDNLKQLLIIRIDAIGDYILFRNFIEILKESEEYKDYKFTLLGNIIWKDLAENLDDKWIDNFIWLDKNKLKTERKYRRCFEKIVDSLNYDILLNPAYSREGFFLEPLISRIKATNKIAFSGDLVLMSGSQRFEENKKYTQLIESDKGIKFEFSRNKEFFEKLLNKEIEIKKPYINIQSNKNLIIDDYVIIFPGSQCEYKQWDIENYAKVANYLIDKLNFKVVISGSKEDVKLAKSIISLINIKNHIIDYTGKTSLRDIPDLFSTAKLILSGDTCAYHFAVALNKKVICISNGYMLGRFLPYPEDIYADSIYIFSKALDRTSKNYIYGSMHNINTIDADQVIDAIKLNIKY